jgi:glucan phosphoethanolaminetransferase (alkaline phosphatase superfamily)
MKKYFLLILLIGTCIMIVVMAKTGSSLKTSTTPRGILDLEFAYNTTKTTMVLNAWTPDSTSNKINAAKINTYLDFIFLAFYSLFLFFTSDKITRITKNKLGILITNGALYAGILDIIENAGMLMTLSGSGSETTAFITTSCSIIKWMLALVAVLYVVVGIVQILLSKKTKALLA